MKKSVSAGGIVIKNIDGKPHVLMIIFEEFGTLAFPKGHVEKREKLKETALREVKEETGLSGLIIVKKLGSLKRMSVEGDEMKTIHFYLMETENYKHGKADENFGWFAINDAVRKMAFPEERDFLKKVRGIFL